MEAVIANLFEYDGDYWKASSTDGTDGRLAGMETVASRRVIEEIGCVERASFEQRIDGPKRTLAGTAIRGFF